MPLLAATFWILDPLYSLLGTILAWFYALIPNYGVVIVLLTVAVRLVTLPLTAKQAKSQQQLQKVQPELKRLQAKYKNDKQKLNEEMMKFYKENHVNPFGACLPLLVQMPVLIVLYRLIIGLTGSVILFASVTAGPATGSLAGATIAKGTTTQGIITGGSMSKGVITSGSLENAQVSGPTGPVGTISSADVVKGKVPTADVVNGKVPVGRLTDLTVTGGEERGKPKHVPKTSKLYKSLVKSGGVMDTFGVNLSKAASKATGGDLVPYMVLVIAVVGTGYYQQRQLTARAPKGGATQQMQAIGKIFPLFFGFISFQVPAGVVVYFLVSNVWQIGQQAWIFRGQDAAAGAAGAGSKKDVRDAKVVERPSKAAPAKADGRGGAKSAGRTTPKKATGGSSRNRGLAQGAGAGTGGRKGRRGGRPADLRGTRPNDDAVQPRGRKRRPKGAPPRNNPGRDGGG